MNNKEELVLVAMAPVKGGSHGPVQIQKLLFLIDKNIAEDVQGPHFDFQPYSYGPFDKEVYHTLRTLADDGQVFLDTNGRYKNYRLTVEGQRDAERIFAGLPSNIQSYLKKLSDFVLSLTFTQLVTAIHKAYPEMRENSVFQKG